MSIFSAVRQPDGVGEEPLGHVLAVVVAQRQQRQQLAHQHPREANAEELPGKPSKDLDHSRGKNTTFSFLNKLCWGKVDNTHGL